MALTRPTTSPGNASSTVVRSAPNTVDAYLVANGLPERSQVITMPRSNRPEQMRAKAMRSRWLRSMLAWTLNTKAEHGSSRCRGLSSTSRRGDGAGASSTMASSRWRTPKLVSAEPANTGVDSPARNDGMSTSASIALSSSVSSVLLVQAAPSSEAARSAGTSSSGAIWLPRAVRVNRVKTSVRRSITPRRSPNEPTGQVAGVGRRPICASIWSSSSNGSMPGRSSLLRNVITGRLRERQTSNSFSVCGSMPLAESSTITTASTAARTR